MTMQKLNVRFSSETKEEIKSISEELSCNSSALSRMAINLGLKIIRERSEVDCFIGDLKKEISESK